MGNLLVLGGTAWLGAEIARQGVAAGVDVTCLARGASGSVPSGARLVVADRTGEAAYADVADRDWDAVVDVSWQPGMVRRAVAALGERSAHWTCVSSVSAYRVDSATGQHEGALLLEPWPDDVASIEEYGPAKSACESFVRNALGERSLVARLGLIGGPGDPSDRFGYWPARLARAVEDPVLVPAGLQQPTQTIDVRDAAAFVLQAEQRQLTGVVNVVGASVPLGEVLAAATGRCGPRRPMAGRERGLPGRSRRAGVGRTEVLAAVAASGGGSGLRIDSGWSRADTRPGAPPPGGHHHRRARRRAGTRAAAQQAGRADRDRGAGSHQPNVIVIMCIIGAAPTDAS
jgi:2'-hydroxyisoflavone reductase